MGPAALYPLQTRHGHRAYLGVGRSFFSSNIILHEYADVSECAEYCTRFTLLKKFKISFEKAWLDYS